MMDMIQVRTFYLFKIFIDNFHFILDVPIKHLWNEKSKMRKSWIMFNSEECLANTITESQYNDQISKSISNNSNQLPVEQTFLQLSPSK